MIVVVAQRVPFPPNKGEKLRTFHHVAFLVEQGFAVKVVALKHNAQDADDAVALEKRLNVEVSLFPARTSFISYLSALISGKSISESVFFSKALEAYLRKQVAKNPSSQILLSASSLAPYVWQKDNQTINANNLLMDFMDVDSDKWSQYASTSRWPMRWVYQRESKLIRRLEKKIVATFDHVFLIADAEITLFANTVSDEKLVTKLGNGMDFSAFYPGAQESKAQQPTFLFTGVMDYKPNVDAVLWFVEHCWNTIKHDIPNAQFIVAGMNPAQSILDLNARTDIEVTGFVEEILPYYHSAWVFVAPFRLARGVQNKVLQASACRLPIVTTSMGAEGIGFADTLTMYVEDTALGFSQACIHAIEHREIAETKASAVYEKITTTYSWETQLQPLLEAVKQ